MDGLIKILFLAANPPNTNKLGLDKEMRGIDQALRGAEFRDNFDIKQHWAVRISDLQGYLLRHKPDIVHFSGHGSPSSEIILEDKQGNSQPVPSHALSQLFSLLKDNIRCVVLNACYTEQQAKAIAEHIDCVIGMSKAIGDSAAISFAIAFYQALGFGRDVKTAFELGCLEIDLESLDEKDTPKLLAINKNPRELVFVANVKITDGTIEIDFTNRNDEIRDITKTLPAPYLLISAPMGYGKTRLLEKVISQLKETFFCIHVKLSRQNSFTVQMLALQILELLGKQLPQSVEHSDAFTLGSEVGLRILEAVNQKQKNKVLLVVDEIESISENLAKLFLEQFVPAIQEVLRNAEKSVPLRTIFSGRYKTEWRRLSSILPLTPLVLTPFDFDSVHQTVIDFNYRYKLKMAAQYVRQFAAHLMYYTGGHPGCMADILISGDFGLPIRVIESRENEYYRNIVEPVIEYIRQGIPQNLLTIFDTLSIIRRFNTVLLRHFIHKGLINWLKHEHELENHLLRTYLVDNIEGFLKDDITRRLFAIRMRKTATNQFVAASQESIFFYKSQLEMSECYRPEIIAIETLFQELQVYLCKGQSSINDYINNSRIIFNRLRSFAASREIITTFEQLLKKDWEFNFNFNYLFPQLPFDKFLMEIMS